MRNFIKEIKARKVVLALSDSEINKAVIIAGTQFDRHIKHSSREIEKWRKLYSKGKTIAEISKLCQAPISTIRYKVDSQYHKKQNEGRKKYRFSNYNTVEKLTERATYKRELIATKKISAVESLNRLNGEVSQ